MVRLVGFDIESKIKTNLRNKALLEVAQKKLKSDELSEEAILKCVPKIFKEKWAFYVEMVRNT